MTSYYKTISFKILLAFILPVTLFALSFYTSNAAVAEDTYIKNATVTPNYWNLKDNNVNTYAYVNTVTVKSDTAIDSVYVTFWNEAVNYTITCGEKSFKIENSFLQSFTPIPEGVTECFEVTLTFEKSVNLSDVCVFSKGDLPDWVHRWQVPHDRADILLDSTHADDEQLFFAGVLPYHVAKGYRVQVVYFTDHNNTPGRRHELLNGLWTVGVDHYPIISSFPDAYATNKATALANLGYAGYTEEDAVAFQTEMLRRFKPQVVVGHDLKGEYSHGQHILNIETLIKAVESAGNAEFEPDSAAKYGVWDTPKLYVHLYGENQIVMNWDEPLEYFDGKSAFQMSQAGYKCHNSQQYTWFTDWLNGYNRAFTKATQITTYSPCEFGLYRTTVGPDVEKNSFFENLISYDEQERLEQERLEQERLEQERKEQEEKKRQEEESRRLEEESKRLEAEAEASRIAESKKAELEKLQQEAARNDKKNKLQMIIAFTVLIASAASLAVVLVKKNR